MTTTWAGRCKTASSGNARLVYRIDTAGRVTAISAPTSGLAEIATLNYQY